MIHDARLRDAVMVVLPRLSAESTQAAATSGLLPLPVEAYLLALDTVPGSLAPLDVKVLVAVDRIQAEHDVEGHLLEIGASFAKTASLLAYLQRPPTERLVVSGVFEHDELLDEEGRRAHQARDVDADRSLQGFLHQFGRFHADGPDIVTGPSRDVDLASLRGACRLVHIEGGGSHAAARDDVALARSAVRPGGVVAFGALMDPARPGAALAAWELVADTGFVPLMLTDAKLYGSFDAGAIRWTDHIDRWIESTPGLEAEIHTLGGTPVRRLLEVASERPAAKNLTRLPTLEELEPPPVAAPAPAAPEAPATPEPPQSWWPDSVRRLRRIAVRLTPPVAVDWYRRRAAPRS